MPLSARPGTAAHPRFAAEHRRSSVSARRQVAATLIVPYCRFEHNQGPAKKANHEEGRTCKATGSKGRVVTERSMLLKKFKIASCSRRRKVLFLRYFRQAARRRFADAAAEPQSMKLLRRTVGPYIWVNRAVLFAGFHVRLSSETHRERGRDIRRSKPTRHARCWKS